MNEAKKLEGGCLCGTVRFEVGLPSKWCAHCHCSMCRRYHGAGYVSWAGFSSDRFRITEGSESLSWYDSSEQAQRGFCSNCGSSMLFRSDRWPDEVHVALGVLDGPVDKPPQAHVFHENHVNWIVMDDTIPRIKPGA